MPVFPDQKVSSARHADFRGPGLARPAGSPRRGRLLAAAFVMLLALNVASLGCSVPVFRYALDRWPADAFHLDAPPAVFQSEPLATELRNLGQVSPLNLEASRKAGPQSKTDGRLTFPPRDREEGATVWTGPLDAAAFKILTDSPGRREVAKRILAGDSAVWVLVESGRREADDDAAGLLKKRLTMIEAAAELPAIDPNDSTSRIGPGPVLHAKLSVVRIRRDDPPESAFVAMLAGPEGLAALPADEPLAALVFGRGRVLGIWPGGKLTADLIEEASLFLLGACSCEVKNLNPGWDLLTNVDWEGELEKAEAARVAAVNAGAEKTSAPPVQPAAPVKPETVTISAPAPAIAAAVQPKRFPPWAPYVAGAALLAALAFLGKRRATS